MSGFSEKPTTKGWRYQITCRDGKRRSVYFSRSVNKKNAITLRNEFDRVHEAQKLGQSLNVKTQEWLRQQDEEILGKLATLQLYDLTKSTTGKKTVGGWCEFYVENYGHKHETKRKLRNVAEKLVVFCGADTLLQDVTRGEATRFFVQLYTAKADGGFGLAKTSTAARHLGVCRQFWNAAIDEEIITSNPFQNRKLSARVKTNKERHFFVAPDLSQRVLEAMPNLVWRLRWTLMRYQGLRVPSEMNELRWEDVDWNGGKIRICSPKTAHIEGKESRLAGILPEVLPLLEQQFELADDGAEFVLPRMAHKNYRKFFLKYLERAGIKPWPALFNNLRKSAVTDAHDWLPPHVCDAWFGHSETIFKDHYAQVTEEHFKAAQNRSSRVAQSVAQQASEMPEKSGTAKKEDIEQNAQCPLDAAGYGKTSKAPENDGIDHWAMRGSNPRHPRCKRIAVLGKSA
jgi:integrase